MNEQMDRQILYKNTARSRDFAILKDERVQRQQIDRAEKRQKLHLTARGVELSNTPIINEETKKPSKQELYRLRFLEWKKEKEAKVAREKKNRKKPFLCAVSKGNSSVFNFPRVTIPVTKMFMLDSIDRSGKQQSRINKAICSDSKTFEKPKLVNCKAKRVVATTGHANCKNQNKENESGMKFDLSTSSHSKNKETKKIVRSTPLTKSNDDCLNSFDPQVTSTRRKSTSKYSNHFSDGYSQGGTMGASCVKGVTTKSEISKNITSDSNAESFKFPADSEITCKTSDIVLNSEKPTHADVAKEHSTITKEVITSVLEISTCSASGETEKEISADLNRTPVQPVNYTTNYMSPYVTTSRGKFSAKKEQLKRDSVYKLENSSPDESLEDRRKRESVKYFRKLLFDETQRMNALCDLWELQITGVLNENAVDMINVAVGQTKLLTSRKFQQFGGLIDQCDDCIKPINKLLKIPKQRILPEDLEGFWSMVKLQVENIDKRFENLERWKSNNWEDPDEIKPTTKRKVITKRIKNISKGSSSIMNLIKQAQTAYFQQNRIKKEIMDEDVILTPSSKMKGKLSNNYYPNNADTETKQQTFLNIRRRSSRITKTMSTPEESRKLNNSLEKSPFTPRIILTRKSILKTPGTKSRNKSVVLNDRPDYKSPDQMILKKEVSGKISSPTEVHRRSLSLRTRTILMSMEESTVKP